MEQINLNSFYAYKFLCLAALAAATPRSSLWAPSCARYLGYAKKINVNFLDRNLATLH